MSDSGALYFTFNVYSVDDNKNYKCMQKVFKAKTITVLLKQKSIITLSDNAAVNSV